MNWKISSARCLYSQAPLCRSSGDFWKYFETHKLRYRKSLSIFFFINTVCCENCNSVRYGVRNKNNYGHILMFNIFILFYDNVFWGTSYFKAIDFFDITPFSTSIIASYFKEYDLTFILRFFPRQFLADLVIPPGFRLGPSLDCSTCTGEISFVIDSVSFIFELWSLLKKIYHLYMFHNKVCKQFTHRSPLFSVLFNSVFIELILSFVSILCLFDCLCQLTYTIVRQRSLVSYGHFHVYKH